MNKLPSKGEITSEYKGLPVFQVSDEEYKSLSRKKNKYERWSTLFDEGSESGDKIKRYSLKHPNSHIILQNSETGDMKLLRRRYDDKRLRHNKKKDDAKIMSFKEYISEWNI